MAVVFLLNTGRSENRLFHSFVCLTVLLRNYISGEEGKRSIEQRSLEHLCQAAYMAGKTSSPTWWQVILTAGEGGA